MLRHGLQMARGLCQLVSHKFSVGLHRNIMKHLLPINATGHAWSPLRNIRAVTQMAPWPFSSSQPRDYSLPNASWSAEMQRLYDHYSSMCEVEAEGGEKKKGAWRRLPSYNRTLKYATGGQCLSKMLQAKARLFTRNIEEQGAGFEYVVFINKEEKTCVCVFQAGHLLEGPPGHVHGGAIATIIDSVTGTHATYVSGPVMTANLTINYRSPVPLGSVVLVHSALEKVEGRKTFISCQVTSSDGTKLHTEATGLFVSINVSHLFGA
ncbi:acyl-coenzyme A thioesterase THEM4 isoform X1 [Megalops cyprinoides]|uniref:acyl-coenzyme A thioesterase THEM4 isoform X1 n=1 Tax=Megalops cyprinoides TaxID=118141 RepID=UPI0018656BDA|nr:acyl-coenzyme A thioesterase THEM4 isoform X1 [Megalops cyprinoides]